MDHNESPELAEATVFGHRFRDLSGNISDLVTLEREGAIYSDFLDTDSQTFHYYRIRLLPREVFQYVESQLARQEFTAGSKRQGRTSKKHWRRFQIQQSVIASDHMGITGKPR